MPVNSTTTRATRPSPCAWLRHVADLVDLHCLQRECDLVHFVGAVQAGRGLQEMVVSEVKGFARHETTGFLRMNSAGASEK